MTAITDTDTRTMRAVWQGALGSTEVLAHADLPRPVPGPSQVLIRVASAGLNPTDWKHRQLPGFLGDGPRVLGWEVAGVVAETGLGVTIHQPGDQVFGMLPYPFGVGAAAEYVLAPARSVVPVPANLDLDIAGAVPLTALTAWQALVDTAHLAPGQRVLVHAGAGGVGHFAVQIAKHLGADVIATAGAVNHDLLRRLGADQVIDYTTADFAAAAATADGVDVVLDPIGGDTTARSLRVTRPGGTIVSLNPLVTLPLGEEAAAAGVRHVLMLVEADHAGMSSVAGLIAAGALTPVIAGRYDLHDIDAVRAAHDRGDAGHVAGKLVLQVR